MPLQRREPDGPRTVALSNEQKRLGGLALATVERRPLRREVSALATLELDVRRVARLATPVRARVAALHGAALGVAVRRGETLATLSARDLAPLARELQRGLPHDDPTVMLARERLLLQGLSPIQVERLGAGRDPTALELVSPLDGVLLSVEVAVGDQVMENASVLTVADLSRLVLVAWLPEEEALQAGPGTPLVAEAVAAPGRELKGTVSWVGPAVSAESRTLPVRALIDNPEGLLRPGMTGRVRLEVSVGRPAQPVLVVPAEAVVETGLARTVWREDASGTLEPVPVEVLARVGPQVAVSGRLQEGDRVVSRGAFLLSADQRLRASVPLPKEDQD
jgi:Cu(I)/Ag(I) efflux system membrane fusion protein